MKMLLRVGLIIGALLFLAVAAYYWLTPANALLHFVPGYDATLTAPHTKHALAAVVLAVACLVGAWFTVGKKAAASDDDSSAAAN